MSISKSQAGLGDSDYARRRKQQLALINQLRAIGAQADLDLPRIAVIGSQSAGKSSLVEAISGINVPRDAGTCTRCPMELRISSSDRPWQCQISIRWEFTRDGTRNEQVKEEKFGKTITDKREVEIALRRAQAAILNPEVTSSKFATNSLEELEWRQLPDRLLFSKNAVCLDLSGPGLTDIAFIDLPGLIQNAELETVTFVEDLVRSHIEGNCLILVTLPMSDDIENSRAARMAQQVDPTGIRTIGVLTKPDTLTKGAVKMKNLWLDVVEGRRYSLTHGYYCTRQPDDAERSNGITTGEAREAELNFFKKTAPWSGSAHHDRFGTDNLLADLSRLLLKIINQSLPKLQLEVSRQLTACTDQLAQLPPPITKEPSKYVFKKVAAFCREVQHYVDGDGGACQLVQDTRRVYHELKRNIRGSEPPFMPFADAAEAGSTDYVSRQLIWSEEEDEVVNINDYVLRRDDGLSRYIYLKDIRKHILDSLGRELPGNIPYSAKISLMATCRSSWENHSRRCFDTVVDTFDETLGTIIDVNFSKHMLFRAHILSMTKEFLDSIKESAWSHIAGLLANEMAPFTQNGHYYQETKSKYLARYKDIKLGKLNIPQKPVHKRLKMTSGGVPDGSGVAQDNSPPSSSSKTEFSSSSSESSDSESPTAQTATNKPKAPLTGRRRKRRAPKGKREQCQPTPAKVKSTALPKTISPDELKAALVTLSVVVGRQVELSDLAKLNPVDFYEQELELMAEVRAYFQVSYKRVIDLVPMAIDRSFLKTFAESLQEFLIEKLGLGTPNAKVRCASYLAEDAGTATTREELKAKKKRLEDVQEQLFNFGL